VRRVSALGHFRRDEHGRLAVATEVAS